MTNDTPERRKYTRIEFDGHAVISQGDRVYEVHMLDVSLKGILIETPEQYSLNADQPVNLSIILNDEIEITMCAHLAHSSNKLLGFRCDSIDMESMTHLRRLIELNIEDPHASERVLDELIQEH